MRGVKLTQKEIEDKIKEKVAEFDNAELVSIKYKNNVVKQSGTTITLKCTIHNVIETITYTSLFKEDRVDWKCKECIKESRRHNKDYEIERIKNHINELNSSNKTDLEFVGIDGEWKGTVSKIFIKCNKHNIITSVIVHCFLSNKTWSCKECRKENMAKRSSKTPKEAREDVEKKFPDSPLDFSKIEETYTGCDSEVTIHCNIHGDFTRVYSVILHAENPQCPDCFNESKTFPVDEALKIINEKIADKNNDGASLEFLGFVNNEWNGINTKLVLKCNKHNYIWDSTSFNNFRRDDYYILCPECRKERLSKYRSYTPEQAYEAAVVAQSKRTDGRSYGLDKIKETYKDRREEVTLVCDKHGDFSCVFSTVMGGNGVCPDCLSEERLRESERIGIKKINNKIQDLKNRGYNIKFLGFINSEVADKNLTFNKRHLRLYCEDHCREWNTTTYSHFTECSSSLGVFCPDCSSIGGISIMETFCINETLKHLSWDDVDTQFKIYLDEESKKLTNRESIKVDIYIKNLNMIIEYNGEQHYKYNSHFQSCTQKFVDQVNRDLFLERYCKENNINLLIISYKDDKRIPEIIEKFIKTGEDITTKVTPRLLPDVVKETCKSLVIYG